MTLAACVPDHAGPMTVSSDLLGDVSVTEDQVLCFDGGLAGFAQYTRWILIEGERAGTAWLQSIEASTLAFLLIDPFVFFDGYSVELSPYDVRRLSAKDATQLAVFAIVTFPARRDDPPTANLLGPIVINVTQGVAAQIVLGDGPWGVQETFQLPTLAERS